MSRTLHEKAHKTYYYVEVNSFLTVLVMVVVVLVVVLAVVFLHRSQ